MATEGVRFVDVTARPSFFGAATDTCGFGLVTCVDCPRVELTRFDTPDAPPTGGDLAATAVFVAGLGGYVWPSACDEEFRRGARPRFGSLRRGLTTLAVHLGGAVEP